MPITRAKALANLESTDSLVRIEAARALAETGAVKDRGVLVRALNRENDPWVRRELGEAIRELGRARTRVEIRELSVDARIDELRASITQEISELLLHEVRPLVGAAKLSASTEIPSYDGSKTRQVLGRLSDLLEALGRLHEAAAAPLSVDEFDMAEATAHLLRAELEMECDIERCLAGPQPAPVLATRSLFEIVITNGLRNAVESVKERGDLRPCEGVVVNWGITDTEYWLSVIDDGVGLPEASDQLFAIGHSTKAKETNFGLGLAIARRAARSMGGDVHLTPREPAGAVYELRWPRPGEPGANPYR
ncbi:MAG TPA: ATP-binding protein [Rhodothermales bacterium]